MQPQLKFETAITVSAIMITLILLPPVSNAQNAPPVSLKEQLAAQYKLATMGSDSNGPTIVDPGTLLAVQKGGVLSVPWSAMAVCPAKFEDNTLHSPKGICSALVSSVSKYFQAGDKVYPTKIDVNVEKEKIAFAVVTCDSCNGINPPTSFKGEVVFQFPKRYLETANAATVEDTIGQVFSITSDVQQQVQSGQPDQQEQVVQEQPPSARTIELGQTFDQVQSAFGRPEKTIDLGAKQIYVYKDVKVTFLNGKVVDAQ